MPDGFHGRDDEWGRFEAPLLALDDMLTSFAARRGLALSRNTRSWPARSLEWGGDVSRLIQLYLADEARVTFHLWVCASQDRGGKRYWRQEFLIKDQPADALLADLPRLLEIAFDTADAWTSADLELAGGLVGGAGQPSPNR